MSLADGNEGVGAGKSPSARASGPAGCVRVFWLLVGAISLYPLTCAVHMAWQNGEDDQLSEAARTLGGSSSVPPGDVSWDGLGYARNLDLDLAGTKLTDADFDRLLSLPGFRRVQYLSLKGTAITDATPVRLATYRGELRLKLIDVTDTKVSSAQARNLANIPSKPRIAYGDSKAPAGTR